MGQHARRAAREGGKHPDVEERCHLLTILDIALLIRLALQIFLMDMEAGDRHVASGQKWHEDLQWAKRLDQGWNLSAVKQVPDPTSCLCLCSPCPCFVFTSAPLFLLLLLLMVPLFLFLFPFP